MSVLDVEASAVGQDRVGGMDIGLKIPVTRSPASRRSWSQRIIGEERGMSTCTIEAIPARIIERVFSVVVPANRTGPAGCAPAAPVGVYYFSGQHDGVGLRIARIHDLKLARSPTSRRTLILVPLARRRPMSSPGAPYLLAHLFFWQFAVGFARN